MHRRHRRRYARRERGPIGGLYREGLPISGLGRNRRQRACRTVIEPVLLSWRHRLQRMPRTLRISLSLMPSKRSAAARSPRPHGEERDQGEAGASIAVRIRPRTSNPFKLALPYWPGNSPLTLPSPLCGERGDLEARASCPNAIALSSGWASSGVKTALGQPPLSGPGVMLVHGRSLL
jgi:hypothetical protein